MLRTRTACWVAATRMDCASDDSTAMPPLTAFMSSRIDEVRVNAIAHTVASSARTVPKASASRVPMLRWVMRIGNVPGLARAPCEPASPCNVTGSGIACCLAACRQRPGQAAAHG